MTNAEQYQKVAEEFSELREEFVRDGSPERMLHEMQDLLQAYITLMYVQARPYCLDDHEAVEKVTMLVERENQEHRKKIERYRAELGWD